MTYGAIYIDPPWPLRGGRSSDNSDTGSQPDDHYPLMSLEKIRALPILGLAAETAHLWLWTTDGFLPDALGFIEDWGFRYVRALVWGKTSGLGTGRYLRTNHEMCLLGVRGDTHYPPRIDGRRPAISSLVLSPRRQHSRKPDEVYDIIERVSPAPRLEMFARFPREGWDVWGNQVETSIVIPGL